MDATAAAVNAPGARAERTTASALSSAEVVGIAAVFLWFLAGGIAHFAFTASEMRIVPPAVPWPRAVVLISGAFELLGAAGLLWRPARRAAGIGLFMLTLAVTPANVYMLRHAELFDVPLWALWLRLPLQVGLLALIAWSTGLTRLTSPSHGVAPPRQADAMGSEQRPGAAFNTAGNQGNGRPRPTPPGAR